MIYRKKLFLTSKIHFFKKFITQTSTQWLILLKKLNVWVLCARRNFSTHAKVAMWVLETFPTIRAMQRTSIHGRTTRTKKKKWRGKTWKNVKNSDFRAISAHFGVLSCEMWTQTLIKSNLCSLQNLKFVVTTIEHNTIKHLNN